MFSFTSWTISNGLPKNIKPKYKKKTLDLHIKLDETIVKYRRNVGEITEEQKANVKNIVEEIREFNLEMNTQAFLYAYSKWLIVYLNKYRNSSEDFAVMSQQMEKSYSMGDTQECLRIGRVLIETQGIYE